MNLEMAPTQALGDEKDHLSGHAKGFDEHCAGLSIFMASSYVDDLGLGQLGAAVALTASGDVAGPALGDHVGVVVGVRPEEQVGRVHAGRVVAGVEDLEAGRDRTVGQLPGETVGENRPSIDPDLAVAVAGRGTSPQPAPSSFLNLRPKPIHIAILDGTPQAVNRESR